MTLSPLPTAKAPTLSHVRMPPPWAHNVPEVAHMGPARSVSRWWGLLRTGHGCSLPPWSGGWEAQSALQGQGDKTKTLFGDASSSAGQQDLPTQGNPTSGPRGLSRHMCLPALKASLSMVPTARQRLYRLPQAHTRCLRANLNMDFPRSQTKQAQTSTEWQLKAALPAGNWIFAAAESLLLPHPQSVHETNSFRSQLLVLSKQLTLFCSCPSVSILRSLKR